MDFQSGKRLRAEAERRFGRRLSAPEWEAVDPDGSFGLSLPYTELDLQDLLAIMGERLPHETIPRSVRVRSQARAHVHEVATRVKGLVEDERRRIFGLPEPPFADAAQAAGWIESEVVPLETYCLRISVELPAAEPGIGLLRALRDWLDRTLPATDDEAAYLEFLSGAHGLREIGVATDVLPYLPPVDDSVLAIGVKRVYVQYGSRLGDVLAAAERIAAATEWQLVDAVHHLLTGGLMSTPVHTTLHDHASRAGVAQQTAIIKVPHPESVDADTVSRAYTEIRKSGPKRRRRARTLAQSDSVVAFVFERPGLTWRVRLEQWNRAHPNSLFRSADAMRSAYTRAQRRS